MPQNIQEPEVVEADNTEGEKTYTHPAYGQVSITEVRGGNDAMYGSDFPANSRIRISIHRSKLRRHLSRDWPHADRMPVVEFELTHSQFVSLMTSIGKGEGTQATLRYTESDGILPGLPMRNSAMDHKPEVDDRYKDALANLKRLRATVAESTSGLSKAKAAALTGPVDRAIQQLEANMNFVLESFGKAMEKNVEKAKTEVNAYVDTVLRGYGLEHLQQLPPPPEPRKPTLRIKKS